MVLRAIGAGWRRVRAVLERVVPPHAGREVDPAARGACDAALDPPAVAAPDHPPRPQPAQRRGGVRTDASPDFFAQRSLAGRAAGYAHGAGLSDPLPALLVVLPLEGRPACVWVGVGSRSEMERLADWLAAEYLDLLEEALLAAGGLPV